MKHSVHIADLKSIDAAAREFIDAVAGHTLLAFDAPMGAGKTTFISAVCRQMGVSEDAISSPTFAIVNEYRTSGGESVFHFDFYRINRNEEALDIGLYDYLDSGCVCLMEWPGNIADLLPEETVFISVVVNPDGSRTVSWEG